MCSHNGSLSRGFVEGSQMLSQPVLAQSHRVMCVCASQCEQQEVGGGQKYLDTLIFKIFIFPV